MGTYAFPRGALVTTEQLVGLRHLVGRARGKARLPAHKIGENASKKRGQGLDFDAVRAYQVGDDIRAIDWRVTARATQAYTKVFQEQKEIPLLIIIDLSHKMRFGTQQSFKSVQAMCCAALACWQGLSAHNRVGALIKNGNQQVALACRSGQHAVLNLLRSMVLVQNSKADSDTTSADLYSKIPRSARHGHRMLLVGDMTSFAHSKQNLARLALHNEVIAVCVYDQWEKQLPPQDLVFSDDNQRLIIRRDDKQARSAYHQQFAAQAAGLKQCFKQHNARFSLLASDANLQEWFDAYR